MSQLKSMNDISLKIDVQITRTNCLDLQTILLGGPETQSKNY